MTLIKDSKVSDRHRWYCRIKSGNLKHGQTFPKASTFFREINHDHRGNSTNYIFLDSGRHKKSIIYSSYSGNP